MSHIFALFCLCFCGIIARDVKNYKVFIKTHKYVRKVPKEFLSVSLDTSIGHYGWCGLNFSFIEPLARGLSPGYLRFGGTQADALLFREVKEKYTNSSIPEECKYRQTIEVIKNFNFTSHQLDQIYAFSKDSGLRFIFDFNMALRIGPRWDYTNAISLLEYVRNKEYDLDFELGNEPDHYPTFYNISVNGSQVADDYRSLRKLLNSYRQYSKSKIIGPSIGSYAQILKDFVKNGGNNYVDGLSFHFYYMDGEEAKLVDFLNPDVLDYLKLDIARMKNLTNGSIWLGEGSSAYGGGAPNISDTYASGFMYLDMLGLLSTHGVDVFVRQALFHGNYSLLNGTMRPNHDYWVAVLHKKLVGQKILNATTPLPTSDRSLRLYAACGKKHSKIVIYGIKLTNESFSLDFPQFRKNKANLYLLKEAEHGNLQSKRSLLNGKMLDWDPNKSFPKLFGEKTRFPIELPGYSQFFVEIRARIKACRQADELIV